MSQTKAVRLVSHEDGKSSPELVEKSLPSLGRHDVMIRIHAASLNYRDVALLKGEYPMATKEGVVPLSDGAGEVIAVGQDVTRVKTGDRVAVACTTDWIGGPFMDEYKQSSVGFRVDGLLAQQGVFPDSALVHIPDYMSYIEAASLSCAAVTAWTALNAIESLQPGQTILIQGTGGVSLFALQFAKIYNARVLAITSSDEKAAKLKELGADAVINYSTHPDWDREIMALTDGRGVDRVLDIAGEKTIVKSAASTKVTGVVVLIGFASGFGGGLPPIDILSRSITVTGSTIGPRVNFEAMLKAMAQSEIKPVIDQVFSFADYSKAYERLESGKHVGKVVIKISD
ncbi:probable NADPH:quinone reductase and related Zn-dependent oxidoreductases [Fusarium torulosum]|uniref:Probable NADPH:quinone reductase and related Zn-dependent oxidoreductases n=1 Tax=Fusarium torulosum TaxID=33205 RepID=A0AAE8SLC8_9HYPO|nr:probable NADPH:quinone reductase and related Zn-dependent oxidoreductases [Fusarium torulosum]